MTIVQPLKLLEVPGVDGETFRLVAVGDGRAILAVAPAHGYAPLTVMIEREWVRPVAAWLAGESEPLDISGGSVYEWRTLRLIVSSDEEARVLGARTWALLTCDRAFGSASVTVMRSGERPRDGYTARITPGGREQAAAWLRGLPARLNSRP